MARALEEDDLFGLPQLMAEVVKLLPLDGLAATSASGCGSTIMVPFLGRCTTHFRAYFSGDWDVHWGYGILTHGQVAGLLYFVDGCGLDDSGIRHSPSPSSSPQMLGRAGNGLSDVEAVRVDRSCP